MREHRYPRPLLTTLTFLFFLLTISSNLPTAFAQTTQVEGNSSDTVRGVVVNSVTHEPVGRALVYSPDNRFATMTDGEGHFEFTFAPAEPGKNQGEQPAQGISANSNRPDMLMAKKPGFLAEQDGIQTSQPATPGKEVTIALTPEALVVGKVTLPTSEAVDAIQVEMYRRQVQEGLARWTMVKQAATKSDGEFRFADLAAGTYKLLTREQQDRDPATFDPRGQRYGYPPVYFSNASDFAAGATIQLTAGEIFQADISLVRQPYYPIKVAVTNVPVGVGLSVVVSPQGHRGPGYSLGYNDDDGMIEGMLPNGNYTVEGLTYGQTTVSGSANISVKGAAVEGARMTLVPAASIPVVLKEEFTSSKDMNSPRMTIRTGRNRGSEREPKINVSLEPADDFAESRGVGLRQENDALVLDQVLPGRYWVRAYPMRGFVASMTSGEIDLLHEPLVVSGGSSSPIEITLRDDPAEIDGTVEGAGTQANAAEGAPAGFNGGFVSQSMAASTAHIYCVPVPDSGGEFRDIWVGPDGHFGPQELPPGTYRVLAFDRPQSELEYRNPEAMRTYETKGQVVRLVASQKEHLQVHLVSNAE